MWLEIVLQSLLGTKRISPEPGKGGEEGGEWREKGKKEKEEGKREERGKGGPENKG